MKHKSVLLAAGTAGCMTVLGFAMGTLAIKLLKRGSRLDRTQAADLCHVNDQRCACCGGYGTKLIMAARALGGEEIWVCADRALCQEIMKRTAELEGME